MAFTEDNISQIPAIKLLITLGYTYLTPTETIELRGEKTPLLFLSQYCGNN